jgi:hypothetical protein
VIHELLVFSPWYSHSVALLGAVAGLLASPVFPVLKTEKRGLDANWARATQAQTCQSTAMIWYPVLL